MRRETVENRSDSKLGPDLLRRIKQAGAGVLAAAMLPLTGCFPTTAQGGEKPAPSASSTATPGGETTSAAPVEPVEPTPTVTETPTPEPTEVATPSGDMIVSPDGETMTKKEWREKYDALLAEYRAMSSEEWNDLSEEERDKFAKYSIAHIAGMTEAGDTWFDTKRNPGLWRYNPLEASLEDSPTEAYMRVLYARQAAMTVLRGDNLFNVADATRMAAGFFYFTKVDEGAVPVLDVEKGESQQSLSQRMGFLQTISDIERAEANGGAGDRIGTSYVVVEDESVKGWYTLRDASGQEMTFPAMKVMLEMNRHDGKNALRVYDTIVFSNGLWKIVESGVGPNQDNFAINDK